MILQLLASGLKTENIFVQWCLVFLPIWCSGLLLLPAARAIPSSRSTSVRLTVRDAVDSFLISLFLMYSANVFGILVTSALNRFLHIVSQNSVQSLLMEDNIPLKMLFAVILGPLFEETVFRKFLIDRTKRFGGRTAVILSAVAFGLFHGNLNQFFYATMLGLVFGYVYLNTGKLRYSIVLHMLINLMGGII
ncbi:CPBP family intramembrane glutamic endopeptidase, partial [Ralstonia pseudosolanacearum]|uniref:CPBP family intramembrane glutamic endopeptidase n=1 Tax=Ralstonia pseudosolanacearum TaxID=1310165 RepID=UPI003D1718C3